MPATIPFDPSDTSSPPFQANVTLDGQTFLLLAQWNIYRGDWYIQFRANNGQLVYNQPLIGSPPDRDLFLAPGVFTTSRILYRRASGFFEITP